MFRSLFPWRYDKRNPARRYCKECGTRQELYVMAFEGEPYSRQPKWWETMYPVYPCSLGTHEQPSTVEAQR